MRKVVSGLFISLDGITEAPNEWQFDNFDADMMNAMGAMMAETDTILLGRVTYQEWAGYWPTSTDEPFASFSLNLCLAYPLGLLTVLPAAACARS